MKKIAITALLFAVLLMLIAPFAEYKLTEARANYALAETQRLHAETINLQAKAMQRQSNMIVVALLFSVAINAGLVAVIKSEH